MKYDEKQALLVYSQTLKLSNLIPSQETFNIKST
jgi:hypothetical protein